MENVFGLVFFATGWGPTKGGINSFNFDLCNELGKQASSFSTTIYCICPGTTTEQEKREAVNCNVVLIDINIDDFNNCNFDHIVFKKIHPVCRKIFWMGHDVITGKQAITCRNRYKDTIDGKAVIFHHMNYAEYYAIGDPKRTAKGENKVCEQEEVFKGADYAIAVGPKLLNSLQDIMIKVESNVPYSQIIPGLADVGSIEKELNRKTILFTGRLEEDNDPIKQYSIPVQAIGRLFKNKDASLKDIELKLYGLESETEAELKEKVNSIKKKASEIAECVVPVKPLEYTSCRNTLFNEVRKSSINIMPSISEGFGLAGYESISAGVPIIISKNSGLYEFLENNDLNGYVNAVEICGGVNWQDVNEKDVQAVYDCLKNILKEYSKYKKKAMDLRQKLYELNFTWGKAAHDVFKFLNIHKINDWEQRLCGLISLDVQKNYFDEVFIVAKRCSERFVSKISSTFGIDKEFIFSSKVNNIYNMPNVIIQILKIENKVDYYRRFCEIEKLVSEFIEDFLGQVTNELKRLVNFDYDFLSKVIVMNEDNLGVESNFEMDEEYIFPLYNEEKLFSKKIKEVIKNAKIHAVLSDDDKRTLENYHLDLSRKHNVLNFEGLSVMVSAGVQNIPLDKIYASIRIKKERRELFAENEELLLNYDRLIIKGDPGSGKSTFLKKQLLSSCESNNEYMYIFLKVSEFTKWLTDQKKENNQSVFDEYIIYLLEHSEYFCNDVLSIYYRLRKIGGVAYFIDGLDEVQDSDQKRIINQQITCFVENGKSCKYLLTSRKVGLDEEFFKSKDFIIEEIAPLSINSIEDYIKKWYKVVGQLPSDVKHDYEKRAERLIKSITTKNNFKLLNLAGNPLLLSIIVILHYHGINPPNNRTKLYEEITKTLLETWIERRNFERKYSTEYLTNFFSRVAFEIVQNDYNTMTIPEIKLKNMYTEYLNESNYVDEESIESFIQYISDDAGIFPCQGELNGQKFYAFLMHRQITEYYAAIALENKINRRQIEFSSIINESKWTEVSILMGGYMSLQGEAGQNRANIFIKKLLKAKSKPIEDFKYNILLVLKWIANNTFIDKENLNSLLIDLQNILKDSNRYRVLQFCDDIVYTLNNDQFKKQFSKFLIELLDANEYVTMRNISVLISRLIESRELYRDVLEEITDQKIIICLKSLIEEGKDFYMLQRFNGCYHRLFVEYFKKCINFYYKDSLDRKEKDNWHSYTNIFASIVNHRLDADDSNKLIDFLKEEKESFDNEFISNQYIHMLILYAIVFDIVEGDECVNLGCEPLSVNIEEWKCKKLIDSAQNLRKTIENSIGTLSTTYIDSGIKIYHNKDERGHVLTIVAYNNKTESVEKFKIILGNEFCLKDIETQISKQKIPINTNNCLDQLSDIEMDKEKLRPLFDYAYDKGFLLTGEAWQDILMEKIITDINIFYKYYDTLKNKRVVFNVEKINFSKLKGDVKIYCKYLTKQYDKITYSDVKQLVKFYKNEDHAGHKNIIYDILYELLHIDTNRY